MAVTRTDGEDDMRGDREAWPTTVDQAEAAERALRPLVDLSGRSPARVRTVAGLDVAYATGSERVAGAVVVLDATTLRPVDEAAVVGTAAFPYVPGLFAFRELPPLLDALERLTTTPDLLLCDGHGIAHPRRFGLACHLGARTGLPSVGVAKNRLVGDHEAPGPRRGDHADLLDADGTTLGRVLRTQDGIRPVHVSVGHAIGLAPAAEWVLRCSPRFRLPETTRLADQLSRRALRAATSGTGVSGW
ncbi:endonuclease V [Actinoalloteichus caeruleus]|nr:endonuclease V [Actinoalloteichus caeruleus]